MMYAPRTPTPPRISLAKASLALVLLISGFVFLVGVKPALADASPAQRFLHLRNSIQDALLPQSRLADVQSNPDSYYGQVVEASGRIVGGATAAGSRMLILQVGSVSVDISVPQSLSDVSSWLDTG